MKARKDTLPDIARRFDVGYEEILMANPGVDPWLPGVGREVVVPTQFILPAAPREGVVVNVAAMRIFYFPPHKKGEQAVVYTHPIGVAGWAGKRRKAPPKSSAVPRIRCGWSRNRCATNMLGMVRNYRPWFPRARTILSASTCYRHQLTWPSYLIPRDQQTVRRGHAVESRLHSSVSPKDIQPFSSIRSRSAPSVTKVVNQPYLFGSRDGTLYLQAYAVSAGGLDSRDWG